MSHWWPAQTNGANANARRAIGQRHGAVRARCDNWDTGQNVLPALGANADAINEEAAANGIAPATLRRAKRDLGIKAVKKGMSGGWAWKLP